MWCEYIPAYEGCPSTIISTAVVGEPPMPRILMPPAPPLLTPNPRMLRSVTKSPGTLPDSADNSCDFPVASISLSVRVVTVYGNRSRPVALFVPVITTSSIMCDVVWAIAALVASVASVSMIAISLCAFSIYLVRL